MGTEPSDKRNQLYKHENQVNHKRTQHIKLVAALNNTKQ